MARRGGNPETAGHETEGPGTEVPGTEVPGTAARTQGPQIISAVG